MSNTTNEDAKLYALIDARMSANTGTNSVATVTETARNLGNGSGLFTILAIARTYYNCTPNAIIKYLVEKDILIKANGKNREILQYNLTPNLKVSNGVYGLNPSKRHEGEHNQVFRPTVSKGGNSSHYTWNAKGEKVYVVNGYVKWLIDDNYEGTRAYFDNIVKVEIPAIVKDMKRELAELSNSMTNDLTVWNENKAKLKQLEASIREYDMIEIHSNFKALSDNEAYRNEGF